MLLLLSGSDMVAFPLVVRQRTGRSGLFAVSSVLTVSTSTRVDSQVARKRLLPGPSSVILPLIAPTKMGSLFAMLHASRG
jgi:hypothetical protein